MSTITDSLLTRFCDIVDAAEPQEQTQRREREYFKPYIGDRLNSLVPCLGCSSHLRHFVGRLNRSIEIGCTSLLATHFSMS